MKNPDIRTRVLLVSILPALLVAVVLTALQLNRYATSLSEGLLAHADAQARQVAGAVEFAMFSGNRDLLAAQARAGLAAHPDLLAVSIFARDGAPIVTQGKAVITHELPVTARQEGSLRIGPILAVVAPIKPERLRVDDFYSGVVLQEPTSAPDGFVVLEFSQERIERERAAYMQTSILITAGGMVLAVLLAMVISRSVIRPILHVTDVVERIGEGEVGARVTPDPSRTVPGLEAGINRMAERIGYTQDQLRAEIEAATAELRKRKEEAEQANAAKSRFLAAASHDLRQPLHAVGLFVTRLSQLAHKPEARQIVDKLESGVFAMQDLLETLLDISRLDARLVKVHTTDFPLHDLLERFALEFSGPAEEKGLTLRVRPSRLWLQTDAKLLGRILMNFISNALRYTAQGGILLACRRRGDKALIQVWDTGIGIPADRLQDVFNEYVQIGNPERHHAKGLGLGLAICDRLAQLLGVPMGVRSVEGRGSVFWVEVPIGREVRQVVAPPVATPALEATVLLIEDDARINGGMQELLGGWGCHVVTAGSADEARMRSEAQSWQPHVIVSDYRLEGAEDGIAAVHALHSVYGKVPVLLMSGSSDSALAEAASHHGFAVLTKPVRPGKLRAMLQSLIAPAAPAD
jgi:signal transduction histidine kinase/ActR/RegA family two-component response regulator